METRAKILEIPRLLRETLDQGAREYESLVRRVRWGEAPIVICGCGSSLPVAMAGAYLFEWLAGLPALARSPQVFEAYTLATLRPRTILLVISASGEEPEALEIARLARSRGATPLALTRHAESPLAQACEGVFLTRDEVAEDYAAAAVCQIAALTSITLQTARLRQRSGARLELLEDELKRLPEHFEWSFTHLWDALRSLAQELRAQERFWLVGGGLYHPVVVRAAWRLAAFGEIPAHGMELAQFASGPLPQLTRGEVAMLVSGSRLRIKSLAHQAAVQLKVKGARLISLTDSNDRELVDRSGLAVLTPTLSEAGGSMLALSLLELLMTPSAKHVDSARQ